MEVGWPGKGWGEGSNPGVFGLMHLLPICFLGLKVKGFLSYQKLVCILRTS